MSGDCFDRNQAIILVVKVYLISDIYLLKCFSSVFLAIEGIRSCKVVCEYICSVVDREVRGLKYLSGSQYFPSY